MIVGEPVAAEVRPPSAPARGKRAIWLYGPFLDPLDAPGIDVRLAVALVDDAFHAVVVVDPGHPHVVAQHDVEVGRREPRRTWPAGARSGMEPHEDRDAVGRLPSAEPHRRRCLPFTGLVPMVGCRRQDDYRATFRDWSRATVALRGNREPDHPPYAHRRRPVGKGVGKGLAWPIRTDRRQPVGVGSGAVVLRLQSRAVSGPLHGGGRPGPAQGQ